MAKSADEILSGLDARLTTDTNTLLSISSRHPAMLRLAEGLNTRLADMRDLRRKYHTGDLELKEAVTNISHDLRTPLTSIMGYIDLLKQEPLTPDAARYVGMIENRAQAMETLSGELFKYTVFSSPDRAARPEDIALNSALEEALSSQYALLTSKGITPHVEMPDIAVVRRLDRTDLSRILENILSNAVKYSIGDLEITLTPDGVITFSNEAPSLDQTQVGRLFDRYYTVPSAKPSTGLGLSIAKALTERHGGSITAKLTDARLTITLTF